MEVRRSLSRRRQGDGEAVVDAENDSISAYSKVVDLACYAPLDGQHTRLDEDASHRDKKMQTFLEGNWRAGNKFNYPRAPTRKASRMRSTGEGESLSTAGVVRSLYESFTAKSSVKNFSRQVEPVEQVRSTRRWNVGRPFQLPAHLGLHLVPHQPAKKIEKVARDEEEDDCNIGPMRSDRRQLTSIKLNSENMLKLMKAGMGAASDAVDSDEEEDTYSRRHSDEIDMSRGDSNRVTSPRLLQKFRNERNLAPLLETTIPGTSVSNPLVSPRRPDTKKAPVGSGISPGVHGGHPPNKTVPQPQVLAKPDIGLKKLQRLSVAFGFGEANKEMLEKLEQARRKIDTFAVQTLGEDGSYAPRSPRSSNNAPNSHTTDGKLASPTESAKATNNVLRQSMFTSTTVHVSPPAPSRGFITKTPALQQPSSARMSCVAIDPERPQRILDHISLQSDRADRLERIQRLTLLSWCSKAHPKLKYMTQKERNQLAEVFQRYDYDHNGGLDSFELHQAVADLGLKPACRGERKELARLLQLEGGDLDFQKFCIAVMDIRAMMRGGKKDLLWGAFKRYGDHDKVKMTRVIHIDRLLDVFNELDIRLDKDEERMIFLSCILEFDVDGAGNFEWDEFEPLVMLVLEKLQQCHREIQLRLRDRLRLQPHIFMLFRDDLIDLYESFESLDTYSIGALGHDEVISLLIKYRYGADEQEIVETCASDPLLEGIFRCREKIGFPLLLRIMQIFRDNHQSGQQPTLAALFDLFDFDQKGQLGLFQIMCLLRELGVKVGKEGSISHDVVEELFMDADKDDSGWIDYEEFQHVYNSVEELRKLIRIEDEKRFAEETGFRGLAYEDLREIFSIIDLEGCGSVAREDLKTLFRQIGHDRALSLLSDEDQLESEFRWDRFGFKDFLTLMKEAGCLEELSKTVNALYYGRTGSLADAEIQFKKMYLAKKISVESPRGRSQSVLPGVDELAVRRWSKLDAEPSELEDGEEEPEKASNLLTPVKRKVRRQSTGTLP